MWDTTSVANLLRHRRNKRYYARFAINGKRKIAALKTDKLSIAKIRLHKKLAEVEAQRLSGPRADSGDATMASLIARYRRSFEYDSELSPNAKRAREFAVKRLERTWPGIDRVRPSAITKEAIKTWSDRMHTVVQQPVQPGAQKLREGYSANSVNQAVDALRRILVIAVEHGAIHSSPFEALKGREHRVRKRIKQRKVHLPEPSACESVFEQIERLNLSPKLPAPLASQLASDTIDAGELVRGLAYTGMRLGEAAAFVWEDIKPDVFIVRGTKSEESAGRVVPIIPPMRHLLAGMRKRRENAGWPLAGPVFRIRECQKTLDRACRNAGVDRLRHHDLRHLFATRCIQSGVPIPTVAHWLGHADGGALAMRTYGHIQQEHSLAEAKKVTFGGSFAA